ncbi:MAG: zinc-dependent peptidase [Gammaproteobacteria bacterium]
MAATRAGGHSSMWSYRRWRRQRIISRSAVGETDWQAVFARTPALRGLSGTESARLRELAILFMHEKTFSGARGLAVTGRMRLTIALQACLPILNLGLEWYRGWVSIIVYAHDFAPIHAYVDDAGVVHTDQASLSGEAWLKGPLVLAWPNIERSAAEGYNLIIHEFAHKLDMRNGVANGMPPLHQGMDLAAWTRDFSRAFEDFRGRVARDAAPPRIDAYAAEAPEEFFAIMSELFFEAPEVIIECYPAVYRQLHDFYRQDPITRRAATREFL